MKTIICCVLFISMYFIHGCDNNEDRSSFEATGTIESKDITISSKVVGEIKALRFDEGDQVKQGDTLILIDNESSTIQLKQAEANRIISVLQLELLKNGARREDIIQAEEMLNQAETNYNQATIDKNRMQELFDSQSISKKQLEDFITKYEVTLAQYNSAKENLTKMRNLARPEEIKQAEAKYKQSLANEELIRKYIRDSYVVSPINGYIVKKYVEEGENVNAMSSLLKISDLSIVELMIYVSEEELGKVKLGQKAEVSVDAFPDKTFDGTVTFISPEAEFTPKNIQTKDERTKLVFGVKIKIPNPTLDLKTGMPADAKVIIQ
jgi:HlyD family secretion protein